MKQAPGVLAALVVMLAGFWPGGTMAAGPLSGRIAPLGGARGDAALFSWGPGAVRDGERLPASDSALYDPGPNRWSPAAPAPAPPKQTWCLDPGTCVGVDAGSRIVFAGQGLAWDGAGQPLVDDRRQRLRRPLPGGQGAGLDGQPGDPLGRWHHRQSR